MTRGLVLAMAASGLAAAQGPAYVDAKTCARCHRQIADDYARTGMGRSFARVAPEAVPGRPADYYHDRSDTHYSVVSRNGEFYQRRWQVGPGGQETNVEELRIDYVMGSGNHARSYLHRTARGTLIELPFGWYSEGGGRWEMSPGSDTDRPLTRRFISYKCMSCHNGAPAIPAGNEAPGSDPVYVGELPQGIDCQRCHGPGRRHVDAVGNRNSTAADIRASIVNPARLDSARSMEICMSCHLETSSGRIPSSIVRFDRGPFSFVPGEPLGNFMLTFDHAPGTGHDEKFEAVNAVYRLRKSECFLKSEGRLTCVSCHNPHRAPRGEEAAAHYSSVCRQCHEPTPSAAHANVRDCTTCHMPKRRPEDTPGMVMTDHLIQRRPPAGDPVARFRERPADEYRGRVVPYYPAAVSALYDAVAQVGLRNNLEAGLPALAREVAIERPSEAEFYVALGDAWKSAGRPREAVAAYREAARRAPRSARVARLLAEALQADGQRAEAARVIQQAIELAPGDPLTWFRFGRIELESGHAGAAIEKIGRAIELDPTLPEQHRGLGEALLKAGRPAENALREALRVDPSDDAAWNLLGRALATKGEPAEAFYAFERAIRLRPGRSTYLYDYALALARGGRFEEARKHTEAAIAADPGSADAHELLGGLFLRTKRLAEAVREYRRALELRPESGRARLRLGDALAAQGDVAGATVEWREAARSGDPATAREASGALRRIR